MNKITREEIQQLSDSKLNWKLYEYFYPEFKDASKELETEFPDYPTIDFCNSLDAQFELAEKVDMYYSVALLKNYGSFYYEFNCICVSAKKCFIERGDTKRTGAELILEAIQAKEHHE